MGIGVWIVSAHTAWSGLGHQHRDRCDDARCQGHCDCGANSERAAFTSSSWLATVSPVLVTSFSSWPGVEGTDLPRALKTLREIRLSFDSSLESSLEYCDWRGWYVPSTLDCREIGCTRCAGYWKDKGRIEVGLDQDRIEVGLRQDASRISLQRFSSRLSP
jgi:hypothetical protein